ncbi:EAL domain-containing protein [Turneriella parva]|uniref:Diguanylate phosphodiesterase n=1 Tax=Turneriella parva (strain ATCC BAA-1111 / DSM 21527 / NCTC 11395 / H) TaxID=869212 RepID=I4BAN1_TURPD|nr:EAL domain-containing protein [Turneriella parva]AFM14338.1 diguanylate phosphodiesterase [Turneriella parva DSM 21527]
MKEAFTKLACRECLNGAGLDFEFKMAFQPVIDAETRTIYSHEALVRGPNGEGAATVLARVNEENRYRFDQSCRVKAIEAASRLGLDTYLNINFIPGAIYNPLTCIRTTLEAAEEFSFDQSKIIFEVTEGERVTDHAHLKSIFAEYKKQGFQTAIDDFGAGYSGLNLLAEFQPDVIKLDMALIRNIDADRVRSIIVDAICRVCEELGIRVVAEGIETRAEFDHLRQKGLRYFQGYYFAKPVFDGLVRDIPALKVI